MDHWNFFCATFGCKVNQYETQALREAWTRAGGIETGDASTADVLLVTFPTRTLGGRDVGMAHQYAAWMEAHTPASLRTLAQFTEGDELCYVLARR